MGNGAIDVGTLRRPVDATAHSSLRLDVISTDSTDFERVRALRRQAYGRDAARDVDVIDDYSSHVIARRGDRLVGAIRVTCRVDGSLESESAYPAWLLAEFGDVMCACSRLCVIPGMAGTRVPYQLIRRAWQHVIVRGVRLDVSKVRRRAIPYYLRLGGYLPPRQPLHVRPMAGRVRPRRVSCSSGRGLAICRAVRRSESVRARHCVSPRPIHA